MTETNYIKQASLQRVESSNRTCLPTEASKVENVVLYVKDSRIHNNGKVCIKLHSWQLFFQ
jgi:hypothetical protein